MPELERARFHPDFQLGSLATITLCHDYICPWSFVGFHHARRLQQEFGVTFDWRSFELVPPGMDYTPAPPKPADPDAPPRPAGRFDRYRKTEAVPMRFPRPPFVRSHRALLGAEFARSRGAFDAYNEAVYRAYWDEHEDIADLNVLGRLAANTGLDPDEFVASIMAEQFADHVVPFDDAAYALGIRHIPTFLFGAEELLAEANYSDLAHACERFVFRRKRLRGGDKG